MPFLVALTATFCFGILLPPPMPRLLGMLDRPDLLLHFLAFAACAFAAPASRTSALRWPAFLILLAGLIELGQLAIDGRTASIGDFAAGAVGVAIGGIASRVWNWLTEIGM